jgi:electron transport complex protein RnfG
MRTILTTGLKLFVICAVAALALGAVNSVTAPRIAQYKVEQLRQALAELAPGAVVGDGVDVPTNAAVLRSYPVLKEGKQVGQILELVGAGYGGEMRILARYDRQGAVEAARLMEDQETPGLGKKAESPSYMEKFIGTGSPEKPVPVRKSMLAPAQAEAVTGATITFLGVAKALAEGSAFVQQGAQ